MNEIILTGIVGLVTTLTSSILTWFLTKKKYHSEVDNNLIKNMQESLDFYRQLSDDNSKRLEEVLKRNEALEARDEKLEEEVKQLKQQMLDMMGNICFNLTCQLRSRDMQLFGHKRPSYKKSKKEDKEDGKI